MQTATYNSTFHLNAVVAAPALPAAKMVRPSRLLRTLARRWDLIGVVSLMLSSGAYGLYALAHLIRF